jgi:NAD(P)-dependent dehydrogenase (short-subunit alcohol dehydrogenase family)
MNAMKDARVVVVGGTQGIGLAVARLAAEEGAEAIIASSRRVSVDAALVKLPKGAAGYALDVRDAGSVRAFFERIGAFDHLVYTAGESLLLAPLAEIDLEAARRFFEVRYWGALGTIRAALPHLRRGGSMVLSSGLAGTRPASGLAVIASICGAMEALTRALAVELAPTRVNIVVPGLVDTPLWSAIEPTAREAMFRHAATRLPVQRIGTPDDIAEHYLAFMRGGYTTGQSIVVDGGGALA